jgi:hypothetical protein
MSATILYQTLKDLHNFYLDGKHKILSQSMTKEDTKNIWFELNTEMRTFLQAVLDTEEVTGIRLYLLQNPDPQEMVNGKLMPSDAVDVGQLSVGLVATKSGAGTQDDIETEIEPINHGSLCPQMCS